MINVNLRDPYLVENMKGIIELRKFGLYSDEELQILYDQQVEKDKKFFAEQAQMSILYLEEWSLEKERK